MNDPIALATTKSVRARNLPALFAPDKDAARRFVEFFTATIRNPHTRRAYAHSAREFAAWCERNELRALRDIEPVHVAAYVEGLQGHLAAPSVKLRLAAIRMLLTGSSSATSSSSIQRAPSAARGMSSRKARRRFSQQKKRASCSRALMRARRRGCAIAPSSPCWSIPSPGSGPR